MTTTCALCGFAFEPGGSACHERGCPMASGSCRTLDCPRCGYAVPDENSSVLARWVRRLMPARRANGAQPGTLAALEPGKDAVVESVEGDPSLVARLSALGLVAGVNVCLVQRSPGFVLEIGETTLALERRVAESIRIRPAD